MTRQNDMAGVSRRRSLLIWGLLCALAGAVFLTYVAASMAAGSGEPVLPLDDAYIHFQYARAIAEGYPYHYNPGLPATSGATSFLYPFVLALGYPLGFQGMNLALWAMGGGAVALALSGWFIYRLGRLFSAAVWLAVLVAVGFMLNGATAWHYMSGMETGLTVLFMLYTVYALASEDYWHTIAGATLMALIRPEGAILTLLAVGATIWRERSVIRRAMTRRNINDAGAQGAAPLLQTQSNDTAPRPFPRPDWTWLCLLLPVFAIGVQPLVNLLMTGSAVASGNAAKSLFGIIPPDLPVIIGRVWDNFVGMWWGFFSGSASPVSVGAATMLLAAVGIEALLSRRQFRATALVIVATLLLATAAISTLDTAGWHFKRYQMPVMTLLLVLAVPGVTLTRWQSPRWKRFNTALLLLMMAAYALSFPSFLGYYSLNAGYVAAQPLPMARWINQHTPPEAVVAVHDTGSLRYIGGRTTVDMVGLTTPGAAEAWRNGPGSVAEFLERQRPDYIASYGDGHGYGLGYLEDTGLYAEALATYTVALDPQYNVALAASKQGIYRPQWAAADRAYDPLMLPRVTGYLNGMSVYDEIDVADVYSEHVHNYRWRNDELSGSFPTEVYQFPYIGCTTGEDCIVMDGGRRINGEERFTLSARAGQDLILVTRLHPANAGSFDVFANDVLINDRVVPAVPGGWLDVATYIPGELVTESLRIHIVPRSAGNFYMPYHHWAYQGAAYTPEIPSGELLSTFQDGAIELYDFTAALSSSDDGTRQLNLSWVWATNGSAQGDYHVFVHLLGSDGVTAAQADTRPGQGTLPPGNWLPGSFSESIQINVTELPPGLYQIALGLYDPVTNERLIPAGGDEANRLIVDTIEIE